jgi:D-serine deaminase-like pyridoxal phosphate-dependent protein
MTPPLPDAIALPTPCLVVDQAALHRNLSAMQVACDAAGVRLRAHGKMHKCPDLARLQIAQGAVGVCAQTIGEAEAFAAAGISDSLISAPIALHDAPRAAALAQRIRLALVADDLALIDALAATRAALSVLVDLDVGQRRTGATPAEALDLARAIASAPGLRFGGVQAYHGAIQHLTPDARAAGARATADLLRPVVAALTAAGLAPPVVTGGGTGSFATDIEAGVFSELQCGSYALMDVEYAACQAPFEPAVFLAATVVSARRKTHATIDAGLKALSVEVAPRIVAGAPAGAHFRFMGDEHGAVLHPLYLARLAGAGDAQAQAREAGAIQADPNCPHPDDLPKIGARVWLQPGHVDPTINLHSHLIVAADGAIVDRWPISARR